MMAIRLGKKALFPQTSVYAWFCWVLAAIFYLYEMILRASTSVMAESLQQDFSLDVQGLAWLSSAYYMAYTPLQLPCGMILDKIGPRWLISLSCLLCALGAVVFATTSDIYVAFASRFIMGMGSACAFVSTLGIATGWFAKKHWAMMAGMTNLMGCLGGMIAGNPLAQLAYHVGWRHALWGLGVFGMVLTLIIWCFVRDHPAQSSIQASDQIARQPQSTHSIPFWHGVMRVTQNRRLWLASMVGGLLYLPFSAFAELWAVPFACRVYHVPSATASWLPMALYFGMGAGGPLLGYWAARKAVYGHALRLACGACMIGLGIFMIAGITDVSLSMRLVYLACFAALCVPCISSLKHPDRTVPGWAAVMLLIVGLGAGMLAMMPEIRHNAGVTMWHVTLVASAWMGFCLGAQPLVFQIAQDSVSARYAGTACALANAVIMMIGGMFQPVFAMVLHWAWRFHDGAFDLNGLPIYTAQMYVQAMGSFLVCGLIAYSLTSWLQRVNADGIPCTVTMGR